MKLSSRQLNSQRKFPPIPKDKQAEILAYFKSAKDNRMTLIASYFGVGTHQVSKIIDNYIALTKLQINDSSKSED